VRERRGHDGSVIVPLDAASVQRAVAAIGERGIRAVAVGLLHADVDGAHEPRDRAALHEALPECEVSLSSEIDPQYREYERFSTTVVNAALAPIVRAYLGRVARGRGARSGCGRPIFVMRSDGGMAALKLASRRPATLIESGPASGVIGAAYLGRRCWDRERPLVRHGRTTAKAGTIFDGTPQVTPRSKRRGRRTAGAPSKGAGTRCAFPFVDLAEVSAGGGTIAWIDAAATLRVGPLSAGADPGPRPATARGEPADGDTTRTWCCCGA